MSRLSERWFGRFSDDWQDLTTARGFFGGMLSIVSNLVAFAALFVMAILLDVVPQIPAESGNDLGFAVQLLLVVAASALVGGGWFYLFQKKDRAKRLMRTILGRLAIQFAFYGGFWLLVMYDATLGIWGAIAFLCGKGVALVGIFVAGRL